MAMQRTMAVDVGDRRIGLAITDALGVTAQPLFTVHREGGRSGLRMDVKAVARFVRQHKVEVVVVGHPLHADGTVSAQAEKAVAFADALRAVVQATDASVEVHLLDERLTTKEAHALLDASMGVRAGRAGRVERQQVIDQVAAVLLLEAWMGRDGVVLLPDPEG